MTNDEKHRQCVSDRRAKINSWAANHLKGPLYLDERDFWSDELLVEYQTVWDGFDIEFEIDKINKGII